MTSGIRLNYPLQDIREWPCRCYATTCTTIDCGVYETGVGVPQYIIYYLITHINMKSRIFTQMERLVHMILTPCSTLT